MNRNTFIDAATGDEYVWHRNHLEEEEDGVRRTVASISTTAKPWRGGATIRQQGKRGSGSLRLTGKIVQPEQLQRMLDFQALSARRSFHFVHLSGRTLEVTMPRFEPVRTRRTRSSIGMGHDWEYTMDLTIVADLT